LNEEFAGVRDVDFADGLRALADGAFKLLFSEVGLADEATGFTDVHLIGIRDIKQSLLEETRSSVRDHAVTFHLSETKSTVTTSTFSWLSS